MSLPNKSSNNNQIKLDKSLGHLMERLARHNHDKWYQDRLHSGWSFNEQYNEAQHHSPFMLSYDELPGDKKNQVLAGAHDTLKTIIGEGYCILEAESKAKYTNELTAIEKELKCEDSASIDTIVTLWRNRNPDLWQKHPHLFLHAGKEMLSAGEPLLAYDILSEGVEKMGSLATLGDMEGQNRSLLISLLQQQALSLAQSGASEEANTILRSLHDFGLSDSETLGILGRTWKDMALESNDTEKKSTYLQEAFACYNKTYKADYNAGKHEAAYYTGINAAAVSLLGGDNEQSQEIAGQVKDICISILESKKSQGKPISFWLYASLGEASLLQGDIEKAEEWYKKATQDCSKDIRALGSMRKQARLILEAWEEYKISRPLFSSSLSRPLQRSYNRPTITYGKTFPTGKRATCSQPHSSLA